MNCITLYYIVQRFGTGSIFMFLIEVSNAHHSCIYLMRNTVNKTAFPNLAIQVCCVASLSPNYGVLCLGFTLPRKWAPDHDLIDLNSIFYVTGKQSL